MPFLLRLPEQMKMAVKPGAHLDYPVELRDILPTFLDAAGVEVPEGMDGASMLPLVQSENRSGGNISTWNMPPVTVPTIIGVR